MKKLVSILLLAICSIAFAEPQETAPVVPTDNVVHTDSVFVDSAMYYDSVAVRLALEADSLTAEATSTVGFGIVMGLLGGAGTIWSVSASKSASLEGGGAAVALIMVPSVCLLIGGVLGLAEGIGQDIKIQKKVQQSEESRRKAEEFRTKTQQVKVDFVPLVDPINKSVGGLLALGF